MRRESTHTADEVRTIYPLTAVLARSIPYLFKSDHVCVCLFDHEYELISCNFACYSAKRYTPTSLNKVKASSA